MKAAGPLALALLAGATLFGLGSDTLHFTPTAFQRRAEMLNPVVQIRTAHGAGSGTVIHSGADGVFVLTNHHVLPDKDSDPRLQMRMRIFEAAASRALPVVVNADVVADDADKDLALLRVSDPEFEAPYVASVLDKEDRLEQTENVYVVGGGLGKDVFLTEGLVSLTNVPQPSAQAPQIEMLSAPAIFGNSGGAAFVKRGDHFVLAGVPEALDHASQGGSPAVVPHMVYAITMGEVRAFLARTGHGDLIDPRPQPGFIRRTLMRWAKG